MHTGDAAVAANADCADHGSGRDTLSVPNRGIHRFVGRAKFPVRESDNASPGDLASEGDGARASSADRCANRGSEINTPVSCQPRL